VKRKVKFQEGGVVETPSRRRVRLAEDARTRSLEFFDDLRRRNQAAAAEREASRRLYEERARARRLPSAGAEDVFERAVREFNERQGRSGARPNEARPNPRPNIPPSAAAAAGTAARGASRLVPGMNVIRGVTPTSLEAGAEFERAGLEQARAEAERMRERAAMEQELAEAPQRMPTPRPAPRPRPAAAAPSNEISAQRMNELMDGEAPTNEREREVQANIMRRRQQLEAGAPFKKGGMVKPVVKKKAGGMVAAKPKKMMKGGIVAKPKSKAKPAAKPMPFKKGGVIKKGRK